MPSNFKTGIMDFYYYLGIGFTIVTICILLFTRKLNKKILTGDAEIDSNSAEIEIAGDPKLNDGAWDSVLEHKMAQKAGNDDSELRDFVSKGMKPKR